ncbi:MAG: dipeptide epimerase [Desulfobacula sp.]|uniref:mandelate racemase/muconate lactonizing enzyme family protein n=1 Tax=Desulfobacula sp. TaxID=2593537 RepID=UPI0025C4E66F|nr:dipeptide epimerase [Desulfobacula sp.]MCD4721315.1 dipeptide epimerase [Desulfobacula sp.]
MKIKKITIWKENLALTRPYTIAYERIDSVENLFVLLEDDNGNVGIGAGSPAEGVTGESIMTCEKALNEQLEPVLKGQDVMYHRALLQKLNEAMTDTPAALAAADIALHDLLATTIGVPLVDILGRVHDRLQTSITIGIKSIEEMLMEAREYQEQGFTILKIKTGLDVEEDIERVMRLKEIFKTAMRIRVDANQGYTLSEYKRFFDATKDALEFVEQPLTALDLDGMRSLPEHMRRLSAADESLLSPKTALNCLFEPYPFGIFNIKLMKCGGIGPGLEIADMACHAGIDLMWGCMDESIVSIAGALHAAFASRATRFLDLDGSLDLAKDLVTGGFILDNGWLITTEQPGLGVKRI